MMSPFRELGPIVLWVLAGVWTLLFGPPGLPHQGLVPNSGYEMALATTAAASFLLSAAVVMSVARSLVRPSLTLGSITAATGSLALFCIVVGLLFHMEGQESRVIMAMSRNAFVEAGAESGKLERLYDLPNRKSGRIGASMVYREMGLRIGYRGEDGLPIIFEPGAKDEQWRSARRDLQRSAIPLRERLERHADFLRTAAIIHLASLPIVAFVYLLRLRRRTTRAPNAELQRTKAR